MPKIVQEILFLLVILGITAGLLYFGYTLYQKNMDKAQDMVDKNDVIINQLTNEEVTRYEGTQVTGSEVVNVIRTYMNQDFGVIVTIGTTSTNYCNKISGSDSAGWTLGDGQASGNLEDARDITKTSKYINPTSNYRGAVLYDTSGNAVGLHFTLVQ